MAGGTWLSQNKVRPGAYINFKAVPRPSMTVGDRGIVAIPLGLHWGAEGKLIEVLSTDLLNGDSKKLVGFTAFDDEAGLLSAALGYSYKALVYRMNSGGTKASAAVTDSKLVCTAKYNGTYGNKITIVIELASSIYTVSTYVDGSMVDKQKVTTIAELSSNDYVTFTKDDEAEGTELAVTAGTPLTGGTDGSTPASDLYTNYLSALRTAHFQTMCCFSSDATTKGNVVNFIKQMRDDEGRYVQGVIADYASADYEGIINVKNGVVVNDINFPKESAVAIVAGMTAGANFNESNTARVVDGATQILGELNDEEIKTALQAGYFIFSSGASGKIKVEQDINSLHTYTQDRNYSFSKNRVIRTLDEIGTTTRQTWEDTYMGKVDNNDTGRGLFKSDLVAYGNELQRLSGIQEFAGSDDIEISQGNDLDSVVATWAVKPVDAMEKLYLTCNIRG